MKRWSSHASLLIIKCLVKWAPYVRSLNHIFYNSALKLIIMCTSFSHTKRYALGLDFDFNSVIVSELMEGNFPPKPGQVPDPSIATSLPHMLIVLCII